MVICLERGADLHMAQLMPLPLTVSCFSKIQIGFTFLVPAHPGVPEKGPLNGCVCVIMSKTDRPHFGLLLESPTLQYLAVHFYRCDALLALLLAVCVCLSVCRKSMFCQYAWTIRAGFWHWSFLRLSHTVLKEIRVVPNSGLRKFCFGISIVEMCY